MSLALNTLTGFSMGASSIALFARVGGGIYTKAADVGADLVGKVEAGLPEDDPRNPAVIADNVGDNVGDVAGMGADLFESYVGAIIGTMVLGLGFKAGTGPIVLPMVIAAAGIIASIVGTFVVRTKEGGNAHAALDMGAFGSAGVMAILTFGIANVMWPAEGAVRRGQDGRLVARWRGYGHRPGLRRPRRPDHVLLLLDGQGPGQQHRRSSPRRVPRRTSSRAWASAWSPPRFPILLIVFGVLGSYAVAGLYGIAIAALGMLSTTGIQLAVDAFGPIADNAGGIAEMTHQDPKVRERTDSLDAVGNTTAAIGKGFAIASAAMTALALFAAYQQQSGLAETGIDLANPLVVVRPAPGRHAALPVLVDGDGCRG